MGRDQSSTSAVPASPEAVWQVTRDRPRTLAMLREARDGEARDQVDDFHSIGAFRDVSDDPDFAQAISLHHPIDG
jgi:hypothetical protein